MSRPASARPLALVVVLLVLTTGCSTLEESESGWVVDEEAVAERRAADEVTAARARFTSLARRTGSLSADEAECVAAGLLDGRPDTAALDLADPEVDSSTLATPLAAALVECGGDETVAQKWIPELGVELAGQLPARDCVRAAAESWSADRFAAATLAGGLADDEDPVDRAWLGGVVDECDAGAAMMAADATLSPRTGAEARTPSRWMCAAASAPAGTFDELLDPAVVADEARLEALENRIAGYFEDCA